MVIAMGVCWGVGFVHGCKDRMHEPFVSSHAWNWDCVHGSPERCMYMNKPCAAHCAARAAPSIFTYIAQIATTVLIVLPVLPVLPRPYRRS